MLTLNSSTVTGNSACCQGLYDVGGGIYNTGTLIVKRSTVSGNGAGPFDDGGGIYNIGTLTLDSSTVANNAAGFGGGGIWNEAGILTVSNSTISKNVAGWGGAGIGTYGGSATLNFSTVADNGDASLNPVASAIHGPATVKNTIIADNIGPDCTGGVVGSGYNLTDDPSCPPSPVSVLCANPGLVSLADNGGPTHTQALQSNSCAVDNADPACVVGTDQRLAPRPFGPYCDIGAFEFGATPPIAPPVEDLSVAAPLTSSTAPIVRPLRPAPPPPATTRRR